MEFKGLTLDPFQVEAIEHIEANRSVVVSAATGTGKTLIADYTIAKFLKAKRRVIYTAPIKALSNQKYKDFVADYGKGIRWYDDRRCCGQPRSSTACHDDRDLSQHAPCTR